MGKIGSVVDGDRDEILDRGKSMNKGMESEKVRRKYK